MNPWEEFVEKVRLSVKLSDIVKDYIKVTPNGTHKYKACCPFHSEKTPSFNLDDSVGMFHCFGCGVGGDVFTFVKMKEGFSDFRQTVEKIASKLGIQPPAKRIYNKEEQNHFDGIHKALSSASNHFVSNLKLERNAFAIKYLINNRGLDQSAINNFQIGFANKNGNIAYILKEEGIKEEAIIDSGIARKKSGMLLDFFSDRIMIPILDEKSTIVGFGGRVITSQTNSPKYLNSQDSAVFKKGNILFNFARAKLSFFSSKNHILIVEGYMDVISMSMLNYDSCVAPLGTSITPRQLKMIMSFDNSPVVCFNSDAAGRKAALRCAKLCFPLLKVGTVIRFTFPVGEGVKDLDDIRMNSSSKSSAREKIDKMINNSKELQDFIFESILYEKDLSNPNILAGIEKELSEFTNLIEDQNVKVSYRAFFKSKMYLVYRKIGSFKRQNEGSIGINNSKFPFSGYRSNLFYGSKKWNNKAFPVPFFGNNALSDFSLEEDYSSLLKTSLYHAIGLLHIVINFPYLFFVDINFSEIFEKSDNNSKRELPFDIREKFEKLDPKIILRDILECPEILPQMDEEIESEIFNIIYLSRQEFDGIGSNSIHDIICFYIEKAKNLNRKITLDTSTDISGLEFIENPKIKKILTLYHKRQYRSKATFDTFLMMCALKPKDQLLYLALNYQSIKIMEEIEAIDRSDSKRDQSFNNNISFQDEESEINNTLEDKETQLTSSDIIALRAKKKKILYQELKNIKKELNNILDYEDF